MSTNKVSLDEDTKRALRLIQLRDYFYSRYHCDIISGWNTIAFYRNSGDSLKGLTPERFVGTPEEWEMYQEGRALKLLLSKI